MCANTSVLVIALLTLASTGCSQSKYSGLPFQKKPERLGDFVTRTVTLSSDHRQYTPLSAIPLLSMQIDFRTLLDRNISVRIRKPINDFCPLSDDRLRGW